MSSKKLPSFQQPLRLDAPATSRRRRRLLLLAVALCGIPACAYLSLHEAAPAPAAPELVELSGLARSYAAPEWLWGHNDSGDSARLFRVGLHGEDGGNVPVPGAKAEDWEDIASFLWQGQPALLIGDIGDNYHWRKQITLYAVADIGKGPGPLPLLWKMDVHYPDGARDAEGLAVDPLTGDILILSKRDRPPRVYRIAMPAAAPAAAAAPVTAELVAEVLHIPRPDGSDLIDDPVYGALRDWATAFDLAPDGSFAVVTCYKNAYLYRRKPGQPWAEVFARAPEVIRTPQFKQTEAGAISADGHTLYIGSEQRAGFAAVPLP